MARGINKALIVGNLGADPEVRHSPNGTVVANISVATTEAWKDANGERVERTEWHRCVMFGKTAEIADKYLRKGSQVYLEGSLRTRKWTDRDGVERFSTEIVVKDMQMLGVRGPVGPVREGQPPQQKKVSGSDVTGDPAWDENPPEVPF